MNPPTAVSFLVCGIALWLLGRPLHLDDWRRIAATLLAAIVIAHGTAQLADFLLGMDLGLNRWILNHHLSGVTEGLSMMAPNAALCFLLTGIAMLVLDVEVYGRTRPAQALLLLAGFMALLALIGYAYQVVWFYRFEHATAMSLNSAVCFLLLVLGLLACRPDAGFMLVLNSDTTGGAVARRLLPMAILVPWALGGLRFIGAKAGYDPTEFGVSMFAVANILIFTGLVWWNARLLYRADMERDKTAKRLGVQYHCTRVLSESRTLTEAIPGLLSGIGETLGMKFGAFWAFEKESNSLKCQSTWVSEPALEEFAAHSKTLVFSPGKGLPGRVVETREPATTRDASADSALPRSAAAGRSGLRDAVAFPIQAGDQVCGAIEFFNDSSAPPDLTLVEIFKALGSQIGQFIERQHAEERLRKTSAELTRSNTDLQQFAYVASHDLLEPLRMVVSYLQLLSRRHAEKLDAEAKEFIGYAVDGAMRMQALIHDLLAYSRLEFRGRPFEPTECDHVFDSAIANLKVAIDESSARVKRGPLPQVMGDPVQLTQVFQNLVGNALKFHANNPPEIHAGAEPDGMFWRFHVRDNGIGIDPKDFDRIFVIFQRLHTRQEYSGTGMGLAIVKKVIERHGGRIWLESARGQGTTFFFTLPMIKK